MYPYLKTTAAPPLPEPVKKTILRNTKAMVLHKIGGIIVNGTDNLLIAYFVGVVDVGFYSNYLVIINGLNAVYGLLFSSLTGSVGNLGATDGQEQGAQVFRRLDFACGCLYGFSAVCMAVLFQPFITLWLGEEYLFPMGTVLLIALNFYVTGMRKSVLTFREAYGLYWHDRYKPVAEAIVNLTASILLALRFGTAGILLGTFISTMTTDFWIEPLILFRHALHKPLREYFAHYAKNTAVTLLSGAVVWLLCGFLPGSGVLLFVGRAILCVVITAALFSLFYFRSEECQFFVHLFRQQFRKEGGA